MVFTSRWFTRRYWIWNQNHVKSNRYSWPFSLFVLNSWIDDTENSRYTLPGADIQDENYFTLLYIVSRRISYRHDRICSSGWRACRQTDCEFFYYSKSLRNSIFNIIDFWYCFDWRMKTDNWWLPLIRCGGRILACLTLPELACNRLLTKSLATSPNH